MWTWGRDGLLITSATIRCPNVPGRGDAPTSAMLRASSIGTRAGDGAGGGETSRCES